MLIIRAEQMQVLKEASMRGEIEAMMRQHFPLHCESLGTDGIRQTVRDAITRGRALGFEDPQLPAYVALEFAFGTGFSTNSEYPWAQEIIHDLSLESDPRMKKLRSKALWYLANLAVGTATESGVAHG